MTEIGQPTSVTCIYESQGKKKYPQQTAKFGSTDEISKALNTNKLTAFLLDVRGTAMNELNLTSHT
jgi:hypothetical protein